MAPSATYNAPASGPMEPPEITRLRKTLVSESTPLAIRFRALFALKHYAALQPPTASTLPAIHAIAAAFASPSALLKHELAYCLGQTRNLECVPYLRTVLEDRGEEAMCRHEAAEALGALGDVASLDLLSGVRDDDQEQGVVRETCEIAVARIEWEHSKTKGVEDLKTSDFSSIDPAPPLALEKTAEAPSIPSLQESLLDTALPLFQRYRAMFTLRDLASPPSLPTAQSAVLALASGLHDPSALFRHEIAFVFGQLSHPASIPALVQTLSDANEQSMVRHEAAEALGGLGDEEGVEDVLKRFSGDPEDVVRESIVVALDMAEFKRTGGLEWADVTADVGSEQLATRPAVVAA